MLRALCAQDRDLAARISGDPDLLVVLFFFALAFGLEVELDAIVLGNRHWMLGFFRSAISIADAVVSTVLQIASPYASNLYGFVQVVLQPDRFLSELTSMYERSTEKGSVWVTMKRCECPSLFTHVLVCRLEWVKS